MLPSGNANIFKDKRYEYVTGNSEDNLNIQPRGKKKLETLAGKTQCDHVLPLAMMFFSIKKKGDYNTGIGSNYVPIHPSCNTKKLNISPATYWKRNDLLHGETWEDTYKWNKQWGKQKFPSGPWLNEILSESG